MQQVPRETFVSKSWGTLVALTLLSFLVRLFKLSLPAQVVFDEVHFGTRFTLSMVIRPDKED